MTAQARGPLNEPMVVHWEDGRRGSLPVVGHVALNGLASSAYQTWAFRRAEMMSFHPTPFRSTKGDPLLMAHVRWLPPRMFGGERLGVLGASLLQSFLPALRQLPTGARVALTVCLPERMGSGAGAMARTERARLERTLAAALDSTGARVVPSIEASGHGALGRALIELGWALDDKSLDAAIVGGLDTYYDPDVIDDLLDSELVFDGQSLDSFVPGEGGAFLLLARPDVAARAGWKSAARVLSAASAIEPSPASGEDPSLATALTWVARRITERIERDRDTLDLWIADLTHEDYRMREWTMAHPRAAAGVMRPDSLWEFLPVLLGDLGAATMPTAIALALEDFKRGDPRVRNCLVTGSSMHGLRGGALVGCV